MTRRRGKGQHAGQSNHIVAVAPQTATTPAVGHGPGLALAAVGNSSPATNIAARQTKTPRPDLPVELLEQIFQYLYERLNPNPNRWWDTLYISNKTFVKLSLVCKDWHSLAKQFRAALFIGSKKGAEKLLSTFRKARLSINKLHYDVKIPDEVLSKLLPLLNGSLSALSLPADMLQSKHAYDILKNPVFKHQIQSVHIYGKLADDYHTSWWNKAYIIHDVPTLTELSLTSLYIKGTVTEISAAVKSPITKLSFERLRFQSSTAIEHLCRPILYDLENVRVWDIALQETSDILTYSGTSWVGLKRIEVYSPCLSHTTRSTSGPLVFDLGKEMLPAAEAWEKEDKMDRVRALFQVCRKLKFDTAFSINFLRMLLKICESGPAPILPLPQTFSLRRKLEDDEREDFQKAYALLIGSKVRPTLVDPPEFFDIYEPYVPVDTWEADESW